MKKMICLLLLFTLIFTIAACSGEAIVSSAQGSASQLSVTLEEMLGETSDTQSAAAVTTSLIAGDYDQEDLGSSSNTDFSTISLEGDSITFQGGGGMVDGNTVTITTAGTYRISGTLTDGQIVVDTESAETVVLVLDGAEIISSNSAPIYVRNAEKVVLTLADGTDNIVTDGGAYIFEEAGTDEPNAAIFSKDDLTINGSGALTVNANYNNGITSKDDLKITGGSITVNAVNDGIKGRDSIAVLDGKIRINAGGDGLQANNDENPELGYVLVEGGVFNIVAGQDGIQAETRLMVSGGDFSIVSGGGSQTGNTVDSAKGLKAGVDLVITGGQFDIDSADDAIHANDTITIGGGEFVLSSGDDAIHADSALEIDGGDLDIVQSYEGLESQAITINDGIIHLVASDDGVNASSGNGGAGLGGGPGGGGFETADSSLNINGGYLAIDALGDGLDVNGPISMSGGVVLVNGPVANNNGALDYTGSFEITGGFLVAVGSSGMAQAPSASSTQYSVLYNFASPQAGGTTVHIETETGDDILTFMPTKDFQSIVLSSSTLSNGATYVVYVGGSSTGTAVDSLYPDGSYSGGTQVDSLTLTGVVTAAGSAAGGFQGGPGGARPPRP